MGGNNNPDPVPEEEEEEEGVQNTRHFPVNGESLLFSPSIIFVSKAKAGARVFFNDPDLEKGSPRSPSPQPNSFNARPHVISHNTTPKPSEQKPTPPIKTDPAAVAAAAAVT